MELMTFYNLNLRHSLMKHLEHMNNFYVINVVFIFYIFSTLQVSFIFCQYVVVVYNAVSSNITAVHFF